MGLCEFCQIKAYEENCICSKDNEVCPFVRRCTDRHIWLPLESMDRCIKKQTVHNRREGIDLKEGEYLVKYAQGNKLYVEIEEGNIIRFGNPFEETPEKVELVKDDDGNFVIQTEEKKDKKKK